ncbi:hypothetical protein DPMN_094442 [Dreissena polymorpha]|uniref:Secreted protein n=1 Tax=Dreissena polymorpha TaxID=45954 RepID=A0A9D4R3J3_DREPO|nr:hypothetical protein DPMN_094442 [Dreissena polymorpha]
MESLMRLLVWLFLRLPFFSRGLTGDGVPSLGHCFSYQILWHSTVIAAVVTSPPCLISSEVTLSTTGDFSWLKTTSSSDNALPGNQRIRKTWQPWHVLIKNLCMQRRKAA